MQQAPKPKRRDWVDNLLLIILLLSLAVGLALRVTHMDWDKGHAYLYHPDERAVVYSAIANISFPLPPDPAKLLRPESPLNPHFFNYGNLPMYMIRAGAAGLSLFIKNAWTNENIWMAGRGLSALFDLLTICLAFLLGRKLYGRRVGLLAAIFGSFTVLHIQLSHYLTVDTFLTTFITLGMFFAIDIVRKGSLKSGLLMGISLGMAMGTKASVAPLIISIVVAWFIWAWSGSTDARTLSSEHLTRSDRVLKALLGVLVAVLAAGVVFVLTMPYAIIDWTNFVRSVDEQSRMVRGIADFPYTRQYLNTPVFLYQIWQSAVFGMGLPLGILCYAGLAFVTVRTIVQRRGEEIVLLSWVLVYFVINGIFQVKFLRYMLPLFPFLTVMGAEFLCQLWDWAGRARRFGLPGSFHLPVARALESEDEEPNVDAETEAWEREKAAQAGVPAKPAKRAPSAPPRRRARLVSAAPLAPSQTPPAEPEPAPVEAPAEAAAVHEAAATPAPSQPAPTPEQPEAPPVSAPALAEAAAAAREEPPPAAPTEAVQAPAAAAITEAPVVEEEPAPPAPEPLPEIVIAIPAAQEAVETEEGVVQEAALAAEQPVEELAAAPVEPVAPTPPPSWRTVRTSIGGWTRSQKAVAVVAGVIMFCTVFYALAFINIYRQPHPWVSISEWIYRNVPAGSTMSIEHWDDALPLGLKVDGKQHSFEEYKHVEMKAYEDDNQAKLDMIIDNLVEADYIVLATNRLYNTIPRLTDRYPITSLYYNLLFAEKLGFKLVATSRVYPSLAGVTFMNDTFSDPRLPKPQLIADTNPSGLVINLGKADESFTVYDHPMPLVFKKMEEIPEAELRAMFSGTVEKAQQYQIQRAAQARGRGTGKPSTKTFLLTDKERQAQEQGGTYMSLFNPDSLTNRFPVLFWWIAVELIALISLPIGMVVFGNLRDRGYAMIKTLGLLLVAYLPWLAASLRLVPFGRISILLSMLVIAAISAAILYRRRAQMIPWLRDHRWLILTSEVVFTLAFLAFVGIRMLNPDLWQPWNGGEKPMEFGFLGAIARSTYFPPYDPFFAGGYINYYYYGQYIVAMITRLVGIMPSVAFNLIIPLLFAMTVANAFSITYNLVAALKTRVQDIDPASSLRAFLATHGSLLAWALAGAIFVAVIGNLATLGEVFKGPWNRGQVTVGSSIPGISAASRVIDGVAKGLKPGQRMFETFNYWNPSRVIPDAIDEFPFWSYLFADLHPHTIGIPFTLLVLGLALSLIKERRPQRPATAAPATPDDAAEAAPEEATSGLSRVLTWIQERVSGITGDDLLGVIVMALAVGSLGTINTWDLPTYLGIVFCVVLLRAWLDRGRISIVETIVRFGAITAFSLLFYLPFYQMYQALTSGIGLVRTRTPVGYYLTIFGFFLFAIISYMVIDAATQRRGTFTRLLRLFIQHFDDTPVIVRRLRLMVHPRESLKIAVYAFVAVFVALLLLAVVGQWIIVFLLPLLLATLVLAFTGERTPERVFTWLLVFVGLLVSLGVEIFFLRDWLQGGSAYRMNTIFKFHIQVWVFFALASAVALSLVAERVRFSIKRIVSVATLWYVCLAILLFCVFLFPLLGIPARVTDRFPGARPPIGTLDGTAFMSVGKYTFDWQNKNYQVDLSYDKEAIDWLLRNVEGSPVIAEAVLPYYRELGQRVSAYTGMPTLLGSQHEQEQRPGDTQVGPRENDVRTIYSDPSFDKIMPLLKRLGVRYIYAGQLENGVYPTTGLAKFDQAVGTYLDLVFENDKTKIYKVRDF